MPELVNLQNSHGQAKPYQVRQALQLIEEYNLSLEETEEDAGEEEDNP